MEKQKHTDERKPPRRVVAVGRLGPGIAKILVVETFVETKEIVDTEGWEVVAV